MPCILGDGHVHIHERYDLPTLFSSALKNFHAAQKRISPQAETQRFLFLTESAGADWFSRWQKLASAGQPVLPGFTVAVTGDGNCLLLTDEAGASLFIVAGRQIVTAESLEVLALGLAEEYPDGKPIASVLRDLNRYDCLRVLPWGAGKWLGKRGRIIRNIIEQWDEGALFLGDNGNRPYFWPLPSTFSMARQYAIHNLPGSDPLPFAGQEEKAGSYGFVIPGSIDTGNPFTAVRQLLINNSAAIRSYGKTERLVPFFHHQLAMQLCKRKK